VDGVGGSSEEGEAAASRKCLVFFVVTPLNQSDSCYFSSVIFLSISSPSYCLSKQAHKDFSFFSSLAASPSVLCLFVCLFVAIAFFSPETSNWLL